MAKQNAVESKKSDGTTERMFVDVELHGVPVPLLAVKKQVASLGLKQSDIADRTEPFNNGSALHQTSISVYMTGKVEMHDAVVKVLESVIPPSVAEAMGQGYTPQSVTAAVTQSAVVTPRVAQSVTGVPSFAQTLSMIPLDGEDGQVPTQPAAVTPTGHVTLPPTPVLLPFPMDEAYKLAGMVRQAQKTGELTATFSLRKQLMWARAYYLLQHEGFDGDAALAGAFHLAAEGKTYGEERTFLRNAYQSVFRHECKPPVKKSKRGQAVRHPMHFVIRPIVEQCLPIWLHGPTGSGKTFEAEAIAYELTGSTAIRIQGTGDMTVDDLLGGWAADSGTTRFEYGPLPRAMVEGRKLIIDEITACPAEVLFEIQAVLEGAALVIKKNRGERLEATEGFGIIACDNTLGLGENAEYVGTNVMNEAFRDRFLFVEFDYMPEAQEKAALQSELAKFLNTRGWKAA
jgi:hypothetical protein